MTTKRPIKTFLTLSAFAMVALGATAASATPQQGCPPGSWFCADAQVQIGVPVAQPQLQPLPQAPPAPAVVYQPAPAPPPTVVYQPAPAPVVVYQQPQRPVYVQQQPDYRGYYYRQPTRVSRPPYRQSEFGINLRFDGAAMGSGKFGDSGMGGVGAGLRFKPSPWFGVEGGLDYIGGRDYNGMSRGESAFSVTGMVFVNPASRAQFYLLGGINWSVANVTDDRSAFASQDLTYRYFGGQLGAGLELRLSRVVALNSDVRGIVRGRTDAAAKTSPEFVDTATGRTTNVSGGAVVTAGITFYF